jgi:hypothetical protein
VAETYDLALSVKIVKNSTKEAVADETSYFNNLSFGVLAEKSADYYALVTKLLKK